MPLDLEFDIATQYQCMFEIADLLDQADLQSKQLN